MTKDNNLWRIDQVKRLIAASFVLALVVTLPGVASAKPPTAAHVRKYTVLYHQVAQKFGHRTPGRNIVRDGTSHGPATDAAVSGSIDVLRRMLAPPPVYTPVAYAPAVTAAPVSYAAPTAAYTASSGGCSGITPYAGGGQCWAIPYSIVQCESGGQNVPNSQGSGADGYYQLMVGGGGSRAEQDAAAAKLWKGGAGASNWTCAG